MNHRSKRAFDAITVSIHSILKRVLEVQQRKLVLELAMALSDWGDPRGDALVRENRDLKEQLERLERENRDLKKAVYDLNVR